MTMSGTAANAAVLGLGAGVLVVLVGLTVLGWFVRRSRARAKVRLDEMSGRTLEMAAELSGQLRSDGYDARLRLLRAAHAAMNEQRAQGKRRS